MTEYWRPGDWRLETGDCCGSACLIAQVAGWSVRTLSTMESCNKTGDWITDRGLGTGVRLSLGGCRIRPSGHDEVG